MTNLKIILSSLAFVFAIAFAFKPVEQTKNFRVLTPQGCETLREQVPANCQEVGTCICFVTASQLGELWYNIDGSGCDFQLMRPC